MSEAVFETTIRIEAPPETVWGFFTDPEKMKAWKGSDAKLDPTPGGIYWVDVTGGECVSGRYVELVPHERIVFTWGWEGDANPVPPGSSTVELLLEADGDATVLTLRHSGLPTAESRASHAAGWEHYLDRLAITAAGGDAGADPWQQATQG